MRKSFLFFLNIFFLSAGSLALRAQLPGPLVMHVSPAGDHFLVDLYRIGTEGQLILSIDEKGEPRLTAMGQGIFRYSTFLGPEYGKLVSYAGLDIRYYRDTQRTGKLAGVGPVELDYYDPYLGDIRAGKLKRVGMLGLDYYLEIDGEYKKGKISSVGDVPVDYYYGGKLDGKILRVGELRFQFFLPVEEDVRSGRISSLTGTQPGWIIRLGLQ